MILNLKSVILSFLLLFIYACGGSNSSDSGGGNPPPEPTSSQKIANAQNYSAAELKSAAIQLVSSRYSGKRSDAPLDAEVARQVFNHLFIDDTTQIPRLGSDQLASLLRSTTNIDISVECEYSGNVRYVGKLDVSRRGNLTVAYQDCGGMSNSYTLTGKIALTLSELTETTTNLTYYFDHLSWLVDGQTVQLSGYSTQLLAKELSQSQDILSSTLNNKQHVLFEIGQQQVLLDAQLDYISKEKIGDSAYNFVGNLYVKDEGLVAFNTDELGEYPPYFYQGSLHLNADKKGTFEFNQPYPFIRYSQDNNNDGEYDVGTFYVRVNALWDPSNKDKQLVALANLTSAPYAEEPLRDYTGTINATTPIAVTAGFYSDLDTPQNELQVSYRWYINDQLVSGQPNSILPAGLAVFGDKLQVTMLISDGNSVVEGPPVQFQITDSPSQLTLLDLPDTIQAGVSLEFSVQLIDPDVDPLHAKVSLISAPPGASINDNGVVTWNVPEQPLFSPQFYEFKFGLTQQNNTISNVTVVPLRVDSDKTFPLVVRATLSINAMAIGDFDGDSKNEVLAMGDDSVFLLEFVESQYRQKWLYPYRMPVEGSIIQLIASNLDNDIEPEILVISQKGVSVINNLTSLAVPLFTTDTQIIHHAALADIDNDGSPELAYLSTPVQLNPYDYSDDVTLTVVSLKAPQPPLFTSKIEKIALSPRANQLEFANVDTDENLELVLNNGFIYDTVTWQNQPFNNAAGSLVTSGDYNGDGINEIVSAGDAGIILDTNVVYSAITLTQLNNIINDTCALHSADINSDGKDELLVGDCGLGNVTAYTMTDNKLNKLWTIEGQGVDIQHLVSGDSDNDGKLEIHWNNRSPTSLEAELFVSADIVANSIAIKNSSTSLPMIDARSAGWTYTTDQQEKAVYLSTSNVSRVYTLDTQGHADIVQTLLPVTSYWDNRRFAVVTDFNHDGLDDIFLPMSDVADSSFAAMQLNDGSFHWQTTGDVDSNIGLIRAKDITGDGYEDAIYAEGKKLTALDVKNQTLIANFTFAGAVVDFVPLRVNNAATVLVALGQGRLSLLTYDGSAFIEQSHIEQNPCSRLELINYDTDPQMEVVCLQNYDDSSNRASLIIYEITNNSLTEVKRSLPNERDITDIAVDPSTATEQNLFFTTSTQIKKMTVDGNTIWGSPKLAGRPIDHGLKVRINADNKIEIVLSTDKMVYWIK